MHMLAEFFEILVRDDEARSSKKFISAGLVFL